MIRDNIHRLTGAVAAFWRASAFSDSTLPRRMKGLPFDESAGNPRHPHDRLNLQYEAVRVDADHYEIRQHTNLIICSAPDEGGANKRDTITWCDNSGRSRFTYEGARTHLAQLDGARDQRHASQYLPDNYWRYYDDKGQRRGVVSASTVLPYAPA